MGSSMAIHVFPSNLTGPLDLLREFHDSLGQLLIGARRPDALCHVCCVFRIVPDVDGYAPWVGGLVEQPLHDFPNG
eukprot:5506279-Pyramimonas_sp.AAC.2